jgi:hypothetical protein
VEIADNLLDIVVSTGVINHVEEGDEGILIGISKGAAVNEVVAPDIETPKLLQLTLPLVGQ